MRHPQHGYNGCANSQEVEAYRKAGFEECGPPPWPKTMDQAIADQKAAHEEVVDQRFDDAPDPSELTREQLIELAEGSDVVIDKRWGTDRIKKALGL